MIYCEFDLFAEISMNDTERIRKTFNYKLQQLGDARKPKHFSTSSARIASHKKQEIFSAFLNNLPP